ncbi:three-Cys-motif partner protein TcmP [Streptomyces sp. NPDC013178]|uniref:three-Cys-motif partner protein TcmP n=1 Tax=Streptomyces sp. NPDC013178 TaxID=3155118 RepID=UPI0033C25334
MGVLWKLEPATEAKHRLYKQYLDAWWPIFLQTSARTGYSRPRVTLLDAFAGPGRYLGGEEGSPVFILRKLLNHTAVDRMNLSRQRVRLIFIEKERPRYEHLCAELVRCFGPLEDLPVHVEVHNGEAGQDSGELLTKLDAWGHPILGIFDSWGNINVPLSLMSRIAHNPSSEVITTFGPNWFSREQGRQMASEDFNPEILDMVFGGREFWSPADAELRPDERWRVWLSTYRDALRRAGFRSQLQFRLVPRTGQPLYLVFGTGHPKGLEAMKEAMWKVDVSDGMSFKDPRTRGGVLPGQSTLFTGADVVDPELLELVHQRLSQGVATVEDIGQWLLTETSRWLPKHALAAVQELRNDGVVTVLSSGKLTRKSRVSLN